MKMKRKILAMLLMSLVIVNGCSDKDESNTDTNTNTNVTNNDASESNHESDDTKNYYTNLPSQIEDDEYVLCSIEYNQEIIKDLTMNASIVFHVLSKNALNEGDVTVDVDSANSYTLLKGESAQITGKFPQNVCMLYNDVDWDELKQLQLSDDENDKQRFAQISEELDKQYNELRDEDFPTYYDTSYRVQFNIVDSFVNEEIGSMKVTVCGKEYDVDFGRLVFSDECEYGKTIENVCSFFGAGKMNYNISPNMEGKIMLAPEEMNVEKNIVIKDIKLMNRDENISIDEVDVEFEVDGNILNQIWKKGEDIIVNSGDLLTIGIVIKDNSFSGKVCYGANYYIEVVYEYNDEIYSIHTQTLSNTNYDSNMLYGMFKDKLDVINYYCNYLS